MGMVLIVVAPFATRRQQTISSHAQHGWMGFAVPKSRRERNSYSECSKVCREEKSRKDSAKMQTFTVSAAEGPRGSRCRWNSFLKKGNAGEKYVYKPVGGQVQGQVGDN